MGLRIENASATSATEQWGGGRGILVATATWGGGSVTLQFLGPDGSTWLTGATALTANGFVLFELPPCRYRIAIATATAVYAQVEQTKG